MLGQCEEFRQSLEKMLGHDREFADPSSKAAAAEDSGSDSGCLDLGADSGDDVDVGGPKSAAVAEQELVAWRFSGQTVHINRVTDVHYQPDAIGDLQFNGIAADILRAHGGAIALGTSDEAWPGATFEISLPLRNGAQAPDERK